MLRSVIVGLCPLDGDGSTLHTVLQIPPCADEEVVGFRLVATVEKSQKSALQDEFGAVYGAGACVPAVMLVSQCAGWSGADGDGSESAPDTTALPQRQLKLLRCPTSPVSEWQLELGLLPEPRFASGAVLTTSSIPAQY